MNMKQKIYAKSHMTSLKAKNIPFMSQEHLQNAHVIPAMSDRRIHPSLIVLIEDVEGGVSAVVCVLKYAEGHYPDLRF